jgi:FKBP12-rapamycin complex-associated protein
MRVLRDNRDSVMAMLEAFVYDPLISWRLLGKGDDTEMKLVSRVNTVDEDLEQSTTEKLRDQLSTLAGTEKDQSQLGDLSAQNDLSPKKHLGVSLRDPPILRRSKSQEGNPEEEPFQENVNTRALEVINRIQAKLTGRDFLKYDETGEDFTVEQQVDRLIKEATSIENLCQLFSGWCPLW